jgi:phospholipid/cholesterol/gamma-HCH transport system substrate-binding protein
MASVREMARALPARLLAVVIAVALVGLLTAA